MDGDLTQTPGAAAHSFSPADVRRTERDALLSRFEQQLRQDPSLLGRRTEQELQPLIAWALDELYEIYATFEPGSPEAEDELQHLMRQLREKLAA